MRKFDGGNPRAVGRLRSAMEWSRLKLRRFREKRTEAIREYVGQHYSDHGTDDRVPLNYLELAKGIYTWHLMANRPQVLVSTEYPGLRVMAGDWQQIINRWLKKSDLQSTLRRVLDDAIFGFGIVKVFWEPAGELMIEGERVRVGKTAVKRVSLDDWCHDMRAKSFDEAAYMGHRFRVPLHQAHENEDFGPHRVKLRATHKVGYDEDGTERTERISQGNSGGGGVAEMDEYQEYVELWEVWLREENQLVTYSMSQQELEPLSVKPWTGRREGPYLWLFFAEVPDQAMPLAPVAVWRDLHDLANRLFRKLARQAERQKTVLGYRPGGDADAERIVGTDDGESAQMDDPDAVREFSFGGADNVNLAFLLQTNDLINRHFGNLDLLGGLSPQSDTATQDKLLAQQATARIAKMQDVVYEFTSAVIEAAAGWVYADPLRTYRFTKTVPQLDHIEVEDINTPEQRAGVDFGTMNFSIEPYSMQPKSPAERLQFISEFISQFIQPLMPYFEQQGLTIDGQELVKMVARYGNAPELMHLLRFQDVEQAANARQPIGQATEQRMPAATERHYVRENRRSGGTRAGRDSAMAQALLGAAPQRDQLAQVGGGP